MKLRYKVLLIGSLCGLLTGTQFVKSTKDLVSAQRLAGSASDSWSGEIVPEYPLVNLELVDRTDEGNILLQSVDVPVSSPSPANKVYGGILSEEGSANIDDNKALNYIKKLDLLGNYDASETMRVIALERMDFNGQTYKRIYQGDSPSSGTVAATSASIKQYITERILWMKELTEEIVEPIKIEVNYKRVGNLKVKYLTDSGKKVQEEELLEKFFGETYDVMARAPKSAVVDGVNYSLSIVPQKAKGVINANEIEVVFEYRQEVPPTTESQPTVEVPPTTESQPTVEVPPTSESQPTVEVPPKTESSATLEVSMTIETSSKNEKELSSQQSILPQTGTAVNLLIVTGIFVMIVAGVLVVKVSQINQE